MPAYTFTCPECNASLKGSGPVPAGKKVKCPTCEAVFVMPVQPTQEALGIREKPVASAQARRTRDDDEEYEEEKPRARKRVREDEESAEEAPRTKRRRERIQDEVIEDEIIEDELIEEDEEADDRPRKKKKKKKGKGRERKSRLILFIALGSALVLLLAIGGVGAYFIWFHGVNWGSGNEDPWVFAPAESNLIMGGDVATVLNDPSFGSQIEQQIKKQMTADSLVNRILKETGLEFKELASQFVLAGAVDSFGGGMGGGGAAAKEPPATVILKASKSFSQKKVEAALKDPKTGKEADKKKRKGKIYFDVTEGGKVLHVYMPSNRTLILTQVDDTQFDNILAASNSRPNLKDDTVAIIKELSKQTFWLVMPINPKMHAAMQQAEAMQPPAFKPMIESMLQARAMAVWANLDANALKLGGELIFADATAASKVAKQMEEAQQQAKGQMGQLDMFLAMLPKTKEALQEFQDSIAFSSEGPKVVMSAQLKRQTVNDVVKEFQSLAGGLQGGMGPGGMGPGGMGPGGMNPGGKAPGGKGPGGAPGGGIRGGKKGRLGGG